MIYNWNGCFKKVGNLSYVNSPKSFYVLIKFLPLMNKVALIFEAHSDDCVIGMGGTALYLHDLGFRTVLVTFTTGETAYSSLDMKDKIVQIRMEENQKALAKIQIDEHLNLNEGCQNVQNSRDLHQQCIELIRKYQPKYIFTHYNEDKHRDHRAISDLVTEAWWKASEGVLADRGSPFRAERLFYFEVTELFTHPSIVIDISTQYDIKMSAINEYQSQTSVMPGFMEYVKGIALARGYHVKGLYGEAFLESDFLPRQDF